MDQSGASHIELVMFDAAAFLTDEETIAAYLAQVGDDCDAAASFQAEIMVARARAMNSGRAASIEPRRFGL